MVWKRFKSWFAPRTYKMFGFIPRLVLPGDILLTRVPFWLFDVHTYKSKGIQTVTGGRFSHAALCIEPGLLIEAIGTGVCRLALGQTAARKRDSVCLLRLKVDVPGGPFIAQRAANRGHQYLSRGYSVSGAMGTKIARLRDRNRGDIFCSQLVARAYEEVGCRLLSGKSPEEITPGDILSSPLLRDVTNSAVVPITDNRPPPFYIDDATHFERPTHWEVQTKLSMLRSTPVAAELAKVSENPESFFELEKVLRTVETPGLDHTVCNQLNVLNFREQYLTKAAKAAGMSRLADVNDTGFARQFRPEPTELRSLSDDTLEYLIEMGTSAVLSFENDGRSRQNDIDTWTHHRTEYNKETFSYLIEMQQELLPISNRLSELNRELESTLRNERERRQRER